LLIKIYFELYQVLSAIKQSSNPDALVRSLATYLHLTDEPQEDKQTIAVHDSPHEDQTKNRFELAMGSAKLNADAEAEFDLLPDEDNDMADNPEPEELDIDAMLKREVRHPEHNHDDDK
jgi:hypothetical protein